MPHHRHRPLTDAEIAEIRRHGRAFFSFRRPKDDREKTGAGRYMARVVLLAIIAGWGFLLYKEVILNGAFIAFVAHFFGK
jgi:hypothetical protein